MKLQLLTDKTAIGLSMLCIAHCLFLPIILIFIPSISAVLFLNNELFHQILLYMIVTISSVALLIGFMNHKNHWILFLGCFGLLLLILAVFLSHALIGEYGEITLTVIGSSILTLGHIKNYKQRHLHCNNFTENAFKI
jgi:hypothetical protein